MNPSAIPTPYDIAELPEFYAPADTLLPLVAVLLILGGVAAYFIIYRRSVKKTRASIREAIIAQLTEFENGAEMSRHRFALFIKLIRRAETLHAIEQVTLDGSAIDRLLFGPTFDEATARSIMALIKSSLAGSRK